MTPILEAMRPGLSMVVRNGNGNISGKHALAVLWKGMAYRILGAQAAHFSSRAAGFGFCITYLL
jgi:hypothetical protein